MSIYEYDWGRPLVNLSQYPGALFSKCAWCASVTAALECPRTARGRPGRPSDAAASSSTTERKRESQQFPQERNRGKSDSDGRPGRTPEEIHATADVAIA
jgi:hypothetical protein